MAPYLLVPVTLFRWVSRSHTVPGCGDIIATLGAPFEVSKNSNGGRRAWRHELVQQWKLMRLVKVRGREEGVDMAKSSVRREYLTLLCSWTQRDAYRRSRMNAIAIHTTALKPHTAHVGHRLKFRAPSSHASAAQHLARYRN